MNAYQPLIVFDGRLVDVLELQDIGRAVLTLDDRLHRGLLSRHRGWYIVKLSIRVRCPASAVEDGHGTVQRARHGSQHRGALDATDRRREVELKELPKTVDRSAGQ